MSQDVEIRHVEQVADIRACHAVLMQLRPQLTDVDLFTQQIMRQQERGYRLSAAWRAGQVVGAVGYRLQENLFYGRFVYVDDLVVDQTFRGGGLGADLLSVARAYAREANCAYFVLDTGLQKALAQRFYFRQGLLAQSMGFSEKLQS